MSFRKRYVLDLSSPRNSHEPQASERPSSAMVDYHIEMARCRSPARSEVSALSDHIPGRASIVSALEEDDASYPVAENSPPTRSTQSQRSGSWAHMPHDGYSHYEAGRPRGSAFPSAAPSSQARRPTNTARRGTGKRARTDGKAVKPRFTMIGLGRETKLLGYLHVALNVLRAFSLIGLAAVMTASMAMVVLSGIHGHFFFFDMATHFWIFLIAVFLFISELPLPWLKGWYERTWPVLGPDHSLAWLGFGMVFIGCQVLGDLVKPAYTIDTVGLAWWRAVLAAGILSITFGVFNILASMFVRISDSEGKVTTRQIRTHGNLALRFASNGKNIDIDSSFSQPHYSPPHRDNWSGQAWSKEDEVEPSSAVKRLTRVLNPRNFNFRKSRIQISKPIPQQDTLDVERGNGHDDRASPILPDIQRPPTALHPAFTGGSRYSEAHMDRF